MDEATIEAIVRVEGLERAWAEHRDDVLAAARRAAAQRLALARMPATSAEPWPALRIEPRR